MPRNPAAHGPHTSRPGSAKLYRGSGKRLRGIRWREHASIEFWILVIVIVLILAVWLPWLILHPDALGS